MALKVIGAGFGRTGTTSLKQSLELLGYAPCYHMTEAPKNVGHARQWLSAAMGDEVDWDELLKGYLSAVDWPACHFWRDLSLRWPEAKIILSVRDPSKWYESVYETIYKAMKADVSQYESERRATIEMARKIVLENTFRGRFEDRSYAIDVFEEHNARVKAAFPQKRLLVYDVKSGWEPLCAFLGNQAPDKGFPMKNTRSEFKNR